VPSRARLEGTGVGGQLAVDHVGQAAAQAAHGFHGGLALGDPAPVVGAAGGVVAELDDAGHVQHVIDAAVAGPGQPVAVVLAAGGIDRRGAGREAKCARLGNRPTSPTSARMRAAPAGPTPWMSIRREPVTRTVALSSAFIAFSLASSRSRSASSSAAIRRRIFPAGSRGRTPASSVLYWLTDFFTGAPPGSSSRNSRCSRFSACARARTAHRGGHTTAAAPRGRGRWPARAAACPAARP
jgi:hypothetical protein